MKTVRAAIVLIVLLALVVIVFSLLEKFPVRSTIKTVTIRSPAFKHNQPIPSKYTCNRENTNPPLVFSDVPNNSKSLVLLVDDPDSPVGTWVHWVVFNMPKDVTEIKENAVPQGVQGITSFGKPGYGGPCPPSGTHRYFFKLYALDTLLSLTEKADKKTVEAAMQNHILAHAELIGLYSKR